MLLLWLALGCHQPTEAPKAADIAYGDGTVADALDRLAKERALTDKEPAPNANDKAAELLRFEERIVRLELAVANLQNNGALAASGVGYTPSVSGIDARNAQDALDQLGLRLAKIESKLGQDMGTAGPGLYSQSGQGGQGGQGQGGQGSPGQNGGSKARQGAASGAAAGAIQGAFQGGAPGAVQGALQGGMQGGMQGAMQGNQGNQGNR